MSSLYLFAFDLSVSLSLPSSLSVSLSSLSSLIVGFSVLSLPFLFSFSLCFCRTIPRLSLHCGFIPLVHLWVDIKRKKAFPY